VVRPSKSWLINAELAVSWAMVGSRYSGSLPLLMWSVVASNALERQRVP
jgi:hypothetical protein